MKETRADYGEMETVQRNSKRYQKKERGLNQGLKIAVRKTDVRANAK